VTAAVAVAAASGGLLLSGADIAAAAGPESAPATGPAGRSTDGAPPWPMTSDDPRQTLRRQSAERTTCGALLLVAVIAAGRRALQPAAETG
jgi:hypothetical protein